MKLILCPDCQDVRKLDYKPVVCNCGASRGWYKDDGLHVTITGKAIPIGFDNPSLVTAVRNQPEEGMGKVFTAFVIPKDCPTVEKIPVPTPSGRQIDPATHHMDEGESCRRGF